MIDKNEIIKADILLHALNEYGVKIEEVHDGNEDYSVEKILSLINDKYSRYYSPADMDAEYLPYIRKDIVASGILLVKNGTEVKVSDCLEGSEAYIQGMRSGSVIGLINHEAVDNRNLLQIYMMMKKRPVLIEYYCAGLLKEIVLERMNEDITNGIDRNQALLSKSYNGWTYVKLRSFNDEMEESLILFFNKHRGERLLIDLRDNEGGSVQVCLNVLNSLLADGSEIGILKFGERMERINCVNENRIKNERIVVLINEKTASVAEWFSSAIQNNGGIAVGKNSYGKGLIQTFISFGEIDGSGVKFSIAEMLTGKGEKIEGRGIASDIYCEDIDIVSIERLVEMIEVCL